MRDAPRLSSGGVQRRWGGAVEGLGRLRPPSLARPIELRSAAARSASLPPAFPTCSPGSGARFCLAPEAIIGAVGAAATASRLARAS